MHGHRQHDGGVHQKAVGEDDLPHGAQTRQHRDLGGEGLVGNRGSRVAGTVQDKDTEEVGHALAESGQRQAGDVLVGAQGDGQEGVDQAAQHRGCNGAERGDQDADQAIGVGGGVLIGPGAGKTGKAAQVHNAGHAQIQVAGFLGHGLAQCAVHNDGAKGDSAHDPCN